MWQREFHSRQLDFNYLAGILGMERMERRLWSVCQKQFYVVWWRLRACWVCSVCSLRLSESVSCQRILCNEIIVVGSKQKVCRIYKHTGFQLSQVSCQKVPLSSVQVAACVNCWSRRWGRGSCAQRRRQMSAALASPKVRRPFKCTTKKFAVIILYTFCQGLVEWRRTGKQGYKQQMHHAKDQSCRAELNMQLPRPHRISPKKEE